MARLAFPLFVAFCLLVTPFVRGDEPLLTEDELSEGWISLFDGQTLFGWKAHSEVDWKVVDGEIRATKGTAGLLCTTGEWSDYRLRVDFQADPQTNSGVFLRTPAVVTKDDVSTKCYELNIAPAENPFPTGSFVARKKSELKQPGEGWHTFDVTVEGDHVVVTCDGQPAMDYVDPKPVARGRIGLQFNSGKVAFKNVKLLPMGLKKLSSDPKSSDWKLYADLPGKFTAGKDGAMHVAGGKGQLESAKSYGDFVLQLDCRTNAKGLNSGVFFRCIAGEALNGYESQIHNAFKDGDRTKPVDCGTGGIFRRVDARRVVADDETWFHKTIAADGAHVAVWVNGFQVTDWTDDRKPDPNPRKGRRVEPGTIMLQAHDPTTDVDFRNFRVGETRGK